MADKDINIKITTGADVAGVDETKKAIGSLNEEVAKPDGFSRLFDQQRLQFIGREMGKLGEAVGDFAREFAKTEAGQKAMEGLSEETRDFGSIALQTGAAVAEGWATGGPIGAALAGVNVLLQEVGDSFLAVARAEEEGARAVAAEQDRLTRQTRERKAIATDRAIEDTFRSETEYLNEQTSALERQNKVLDARRSLQAAEGDLKDSQDRLAGVPEEEIRVNKIQRERIAEQEQIQRREFMAREAAVKQERVERTQNRETIAIGKKEGGTSSDEYRDSYQTLQDEKQKLKELQRAAEAAAKIRDDELKELQIRTADRLTGSAGRSMGDATRDTETRARDREREAARRASEERSTATRRQGLGQQGEGIANQAAGARGVNSRQAAALEKMGDDLSKNPTEAAADVLGKSLEKLAATLAGRDEPAARKFRDLAQKIERIEAQLKKKDTPGG